MIMSLKQKKIKFKPRIKLNHNIDITGLKTQLARGSQFVFLET